MRMANTVNYDDNLFYLMTVMRALRSGLQLEIDPELYLDRIVEDIFFIDRTIEQVYETLRRNTYLINRREHLRQLMRAKRGFADLLDDLVGDNTVFGKHLASFRGKLAAARDKHVRDISDILRAMDGTPIEDDPHTIVSQDEYRFLFQSDEEQE
jgi:hypothetical protein